VILTNNSSLAADSPRLTSSTGGWPLACLNARRTALARNTTETSPPLRLPEDHQAALLLLRKVTSPTIIKYFDNNSIKTYFSFHKVLVTMAPSIQRYLFLDSAEHSTFIAETKTCHISHYYRPRKTPPHSGTAHTIALKRNFS